jgi:hypothetical protein
MTLIATRGKKNFRFSGFEATGVYVYEETLVGWPESKVFWQHKDGHSVGLAPTQTDFPDRKSSGFFKLPLRE